MGTCAVTGAFGFTGRYIARRLLDRGHSVITLTGSVNRANPFKGVIPAHPYRFEEPSRMRHSLEGVRVFYNTYWVRFNHPLFTFKDAFKNSLIMIDAARSAGVERIVHVSITHASEDSSFEYFRLKGKLEKAVQGSGMSYCILRPAVLFGPEDILINNIAWLLRRVPIFAVFGEGDYRIQPIHVDDLAALAVSHGEKSDNSIIDAVGPETLTYRQLVGSIGRIIGKRRPIISIHPAVGYMASLLIGKLMRDEFVTYDEIKGLMAGLLSTDSPPAGQIRLTQWAAEHADSLGRKYASEMARRTNRELPFSAL